MAKPLNSRNAAIQALREGHTVSASLNLNDCQPQDGTHVSRTQGGLNAITAYRITEDGILSFSDSHFTATTDGHPIQQFMRYQIRPDDSVIFSIWMFTLPDYALRASPYQYNCQLGHGLTLTVH